MTAICLLVQKICVLMEDVVINPLSASCHAGKGVFLFNCPLRTKKINKKKKVTAPPIIASRSVPR